MNVHKVCYNSVFFQFGDNPGISCLCILINLFGFRALMSGLMCMHDNTKDCISHVDGEISKMAANLFLTPMMMKCQAEPHYCSCGRCASVVLGRVIYNPATNVKDICRYRA